MIISEVDPHGSGKDMPLNFFLLSNCDLGACAHVHQGKSLLQLRLHSGCLHVKDRAII